VARINVCEFCMDIGRSFTIKVSMNEAKFDALEQYGTSALFTAYHHHPPACAITRWAWRLSSAC